MKTAMQELIDELKLIEAYPMNPLVLRIATDLLEKEKEQIENAYRDGLVANRYNGNENTEEYYYNLYNQSIKKITITENNNQPNL
jgi:hypothetical protein